MKKKKLTNKVQEVIDEFSSPSPTDPHGSYTGTPVDYGSVPTQDADDL
ncbi:hypothetical protein LJB83_00340 [Clostridia bacterium OttesenSCG-928-F22]|nr:hypothetical protein [Clostridia bacterium OttesenSCG-928-F22]